MTCPLCGRLVRAAGRMSQAALGEHFATACPATDPRVERIPVR